MPNYKIAPSLLSANFAKLGEECDKVIAAGADRIHLDVMDNHYVPNLTVGPMVCKALRDHGVTKEIDVHLMVKPVDELIHSFAKAGASIISFHPEASKHIDRSLQLIRDHGLQAGLAFNPATPFDCLQHVINKVDMILIMSVNPGFGGQSFIKNALNKISQARELIKQVDHPIDIEVDGGVKIENIAEIAKAGANAFVAGSAIFNSIDYQQAIQAMRDELSTVT